MCRIVKISRGFSAIELMVVVAIAAIMSAVALPGFISWIQANKLRGSCITLAADLERARIRAMRENAFVVVQFNEDGYFIFIDNGAVGGVAGDWVMSGGEQLVENRVLASGVTIKTDELMLPNMRMRFNGRGISPEIAGEEAIPFISKIGRRQISINRLGRIIL